MRLPTCSQLRLTSKSEEEMRDYAWIVYTVIENHGKAMGIPILKGEEELASTQAEIVVARHSWSDGVQGRIPGRSIGSGVSRSSGSQLQSSRLHFCGGRLLRAR